MSGTVHAFDFLASQSIKSWGAVVPIFGTDRFLRSRVIGHLEQILQNGGSLPDASPEDDQDLRAPRFDGDQTSWVDVHDELSTVSLFDTGTRIAIVNDADKFVKDERDRIEQLLDQKSGDSCLILCVNNWPANTRLYKHCDKSSLQIDVGPPQIKRGRSKSRDDKRILHWIMEHGQNEYQISLDQNSARQLFDLLDDDFGRIDQELAKLSLVRPNAKISPQDIVEIVGGWKSKSIWQAIDHAADGELDQAWLLLNRLLQSGEHPLALYGQLSWSLRRFGQACEIYTRSERHQQAISLRDALKQAGFRSWGNELEDAERRLKRIGRDRAGHFHQWLLETDLALKGTHSHESRGRFALEMLLARIAA